MPVCSAFLILIVLSFVRFTRTSPSMIVLWGQPTGTPTPEPEAYSTWNSCLMACLSADTCVLAASKTNVESDGCNIYLYGKVTNVQSTSKYTTMVAFKINMNDSKCPSETSDPPMFGESILYVSLLNASAAANSNLKQQRDNTYTITQPTTGNWVLTYGGCLENELSFTRYDVNYCLNKFTTLVSDYSTAENECEKNSGFLHASLNHTEFTILKNNIGNSSIDYWVDGSTNCDGSPCSPGTYYSNRLQQSVIGDPSPEQCYYVGPCDPCLQYDIEGFVDTSCTDVPAGYICIFQL